MDHSFCIKWEENLIVLDGSTQVTLSYNNSHITLSLAHILPALLESNHFDQSAPTTLT